MLHVKDLISGAVLPERIERVTSVAWAADSRTLFYTVEDETTKRSHRLYRHAIGSTEPDPLLYEETDERFRLEVERSRSKDFIFLTIVSHTTSEVRFSVRISYMAIFKPSPRAKATMNMSAIIQGSLAIRRTACFTSARILVAEHSV
jgi:protease II